MSFVLPILNAYLRLTEKPHLRRETSPERLRSVFERKSRLFFHAPFGTRRRETDLGGVPALEVLPKSEPGPLVLLYLHGGAYVFGSPRTHAAMLGALARRCNARAVLPDYRKAPEHPFPAAPEDAMACYKALLKTGVSPENIVIGGDSAGGGLALSLLGSLIAEGIALPRGVFAFSPLTDMGYSGASVTENGAKDVVLPNVRVEDMTRMYLGDQNRLDPRASPLFADFAGACPIWLAVGDTEILRDDTLRMADRLRESSVDVDMALARDHPHVWPIFHNLLPEARRTLDDVAHWIRRLPSPQGES